MKSVAKALLSIVTSSKLWMTTVALVWIRWDYWADTKVLTGFQTPEQIAGFVAMNHDKNDLTKWVILGFLGITGAVQMAGGSVSTNLMRRFNARSTAGDSTRDED